MWEAAYPLFEWHKNSWLGITISDSIWLFPAVETVHILAMAIMFGGILVLNLRLMGLGLTRQPLPLLSKTLNPFINWGFIFMVLSGYAMFCSEAIKYYGNEGFKFKMIALAAVVVFQYTFFNSLVKKEDGQRSPIASYGAALISFTLWFLVGAAGRAIGFV